MFFYILLPLVKPFQRYQNYSTYSLSFYEVAFSSIQTNRNTSPPETHHPKLICHTDKKYLKPPPLLRVLTKQKPTVRGSGWVNKLVYSTFSRSSRRSQIRLIPSFDFSFLINSLVQFVKFYLQKLVFSYIYGIRQTPEK